VPSRIRLTYFSQTGCAARPSGTLSIRCVRVAGREPTTERRYRAQQMALWLDLIPRLHRAPNLGPANYSPNACYHQLDDADRDSTFEPHAARVADLDCGHRKHVPTVELPVGVTSFPVVTRPSGKHAEQRRTTLSYVTPRYRMMMIIIFSNLLLLRILLLILLLLLCNYNYRSS